MKKITILFYASIFFSFHTFAQSISKDEASAIVKSYLKTSGKQNSYNVLSRQDILQGNDQICFVFILQPKGYVIVSSDKNLPPVIAYSFENDFGNTSNDNPLLTLIKKDISSRIKYFSKNTITGKYEQIWNKLLNNMKSTDSTFQQWPDVGDGWLKTNWTQNAPFYNFCPVDPVTGQRSLAGCPAVAMAQILNFHKATNNTHFDDSDDYYHNYAGRQYMIDDDYALNGFPSFPELNDYLDTLNAYYNNSVILTDTDKAALTFACGIAATQVYTSSGSGTFSVNQALAAYLRFGFSTAELLDSNDADLYDRLKQNIKDTLPAHLAVVDSAWSSGHNVVVDGYNTDEYYHLNFGWGGAYNAWYLLPQEIPYNLTVIEGVVVDIIKPNIALLEEANEASFHNLILFPNPSNAVFNILHDFKKIKEIKIFDVHGKTMYDEKNPTASKIDITGFANGLYFVKIISDEGAKTGKIIKQ